MDDHMFSGDSNRVYDLASEIFQIMAAPMRLKIIYSLADGEKNVTDLLTFINTTQPNMSQHLNLLYKSGVLGKRREGVQIYYRVINEKALQLCTSVCAQVSMELHNENVPIHERLVRSN